MTITSKHFDFDTRKGTSHMRSYGFAAAVLLTFASLALGCAESGDDVTRVQTNLVDKSVFEGEWWYSSTIVNTDYDEAYVFGSAGAFGPFEGSMAFQDLGLLNCVEPRYSGICDSNGHVARIRWVIDENYLFAYRAYELIEGGNADGRSAEFRGQPIAAYKIEAHVDVRKDYNAVTGEVSNVTVENTSDRRWYERQYVRVDWSQNHITSFVPNVTEYAALFNMFQKEPVPFYFQEGGHAGEFPDSWKPQFVRAGDDPTYRFRSEWPEAEAGKVHYMSFVTQEIWSPGGNCLFLGGGVCASAAVTMRSSYLRVPPNHDYNSETQTNDEFDRFGLIRAVQRTYVRGGEERPIRHVACGDAACAGGCDTATNTCRQVICTQDTVEADCGPGGLCDPVTNLCSGGLTDDQGETDFLAFYRPRHNFWVDSLTETDCHADYECDGRYSSYPAPEGAGAGSTCDRSAHKCTRPYGAREIREVAYHLNAGFPPYLVRSAFQVIGDWNEVFMRGQRSVKGLPGAGQVACDADPGDSCECGDGPLAHRLCDVPVRMECQNTDPTQYCYCGSAEDAGGTCNYRYDPFQTPDAAAALGVANPYNCYIGKLDPATGEVVGAADPDVASPTSFDDYGSGPQAYAYGFTGDECMLVLKSNSCDLKSDAPCEELGDLRYQFFNYIQHGAVQFGGVSIPLSDPESGELIVSNANVAGESIESVGSTATQFFPVLRGETPEDEYFAGEHLRGYFDRTGRTVRPVAIARSGEDGYTIEDGSRPALPVGALSTDLHSRIVEQLDELQPRLQQLYGTEAHVNLFSGRMRNLAGTDIESRLLASLGTDGRDAITNHIPEWQRTAGMSITQDPVKNQVSPFRGNFLNTLTAEQRRQDLLSRLQMDPPLEGLYSARFWRYWAEMFRGKDLGEASLRIRQAFLRGIQHHEMGHSTGMRHNFAASLDRDNYYDGYFNIAKDLPLPQYFDADLPANCGSAPGCGDGFLNGQEINWYVRELRRVRDARDERGSGNVMASSVMDYHGDLSDLSGLGHYDFGATFYNYFNQMEGYNGDPGARACSTDADCGPGRTCNASGHVCQGFASTSLTGVQWSDQYGRSLFTYYRGGESCNANTDCPNAVYGEDGSIIDRSPLVRDGAPTQPVWQRCIRNPRFERIPTACGGDHDCICSTFDEDFIDYELGAGVDAGYRSDANGDGVRDYTAVKYLYCTDERVNDISWCSRFDAGEGFQEVIDHYRRTWTEQYPRAYYRNYRRSGMRGGNSIGSVVDAVKIYQHLFFRYYYEPSFRRDEGPLGLDAQFSASIDAMNWFGEMASLPDVGSYQFDAATNTYNHISSEPGVAGAEFSLLPGQGYAMWSQYQEGIEGFFRTERAGVFYDKYIALLALALRDWGFSYTIDERFYINFHDLFPIEMTEFFGGMIVDDPRWFGPRVTLAGGTPTVRFMNYWRGDSRCGESGDQPCRGSQVETYPEPAIGGTSNDVLRQWATVLALAQFPVFYDTSFEQRLSIYKMGSGEGHTIPTRFPDGTLTCAYGDAGCANPDYIVYSSDRFHTDYVAVLIRPRLAFNLPEEQLGFQLLRRLVDTQARLRAGGPDEEMRKLSQQLQRDESFLDMLIEVQNRYGISSPY